jgi:hypothetical protein
MKAKALLTLFILMANLFVISQNQDWEVHIGTNGRYDEAEGLSEFYDNGYYIDGGYDIDGHWYGWEIKTNINGITLWDKTLQHNMFEIASRASAIDFDGNIYTCGFKMVNTTWPFISKLNPCGNKEWCKIIVDDQLHNGSSMDILINENDLILVLSNYISLDQETKIYLECFDKNGEYLWKKEYASIEDHPWIYEPVVYDIMEHNKEYYISGYCYWPFPSDTTHYFLRPLYIGIDSLFNEKWILPFYALDSVFGDAYYSIPLNDSVLMGVGVRRTFGNEAYSLLMFYNTDGENVGFSQITNDQIGSGIISNYMREVTKINDTTFLATGFYEPVYSNFYVADFKTDTSANLFNFKLRPNVIGIPSLIKTSDNNYVIASTITESSNDKNIYLYKIDKNLEFVPFDTNTYTYDSLCPEQIQSGTIDLSACMLWTGEEEIPSPEEYYSFIATIPITAYPNPAEIEITLAFQNTEHHTNMLLECYNIYGQKMHSEKIWKGQQQTKLNVSNWSKGLYFAVVKGEGKVAGTGRFVRR